MTDDSGMLSIDFLVGFTIFILAFIWVVSMIPGLLIGLQAYTIDYDAVAYRTGVILVEDPGYPDYLDRDNLGWEELLKNDKRNVDRLGLALSRDTPNILSQEKVNAFFRTSASYNLTAFTYPQDYQTRAIFGDYPYRFNISLRDTDKNEIRSVGDVIPLSSSYGYIRRLVKIKESSNATFNQTDYNNLTLTLKNSQNVSTHTFSIFLNTTRLISGDVKDPAYQINPVREQIVINLTDLNKTINQPLPVIITLSNFKIKRVGDPNTYPFLDSLYIDGKSTPQLSLPVNVNSSVSLKFKPTFFDVIMKDAEGSQIYLNLTFNLKDSGGFPKCSTFLNNSWARPFEYNYTQKNVGPPQLHPAILEVAVW